MSLADQIAKAEAKFIVHTDVGYDRNAWQKKKKERVEKDMDKCPTGASYVWVSSGGVWKPGRDVGVFYQDEERAARAWYYALLDYADSVADEGAWATCHLWWKQKPQWHSADYLALNQAELLQGGHPLAGQFTLALGSVFSQLVITREDDGS